MGAKTWMLAYVDGDAAAILKARPPLDRQGAYRQVKRLFPSEELIPIDDGDLSFTSPPDNEIYVGSFPGLTVVAAAEFGIDYPSQLPKIFIQASPSSKIVLHAMHSVVDWFAFAVWQEGQLVRALSLSPDSGVLEDLGERLPFELPYWEGRHPALGPEEADEDYPFPFHPLDFGEAALREFFGYQIEGFHDETLLEAEDIPLLAFRRKRPWWRFW